MEQKPPLINIPVAILIAGALIAGAVIWTQYPSGRTNNTASVPSLDKRITPVSKDDHILGNPNAKIKIVEYSDPSCPFCKIFHTTMRRVMDNYGKSGDVAWVYRHFPLDKPGTRSDGGALHPNAGKEAHAMECAATLGGNDKFWAYTNMFYDTTPSVTADSPNGLDLKELPKIAQSVGLNVDDFNNCMSSGKFTEKIEGQFTEGINAGIQGTPSSILITPSGEYIPLEGARSYEQVVQAIDALLAEK